MGTPAEAVTNHGTPSPTSTLITWDPTALATAIEPCPFLATATACTVSGICAPTAMTNIPMPEA
eukprot:12327185-Karenia_brevis.AAC.1